MAKWEFERRVFFVWMLLAGSVLLVYCANVLLLLFAGVLVAILLSGVANFTARAVHLGYKTALFGVLVVCLAFLGLTLYFGAPLLLGELQSLKGQLLDVLESQGRAKSAVAEIFQSVQGQLAKPQTLQSIVGGAFGVVVRKLLADFIAKGGKGFVCEHCARLRGINHESFVEGATAVEQGDILRVMKPGIVSLSY